MIPCYNEALIIQQNIKLIIDFLSHKGFAWEIVVVDDGSTDDSVKEILSIKHVALKLIHYNLNKGKGTAIRIGIINSSGEYIIFMDADLSVSLTSIDTFLNKIESSDIEIFVASRKQIRSHVLVRQPWLREQLGKGFTTLARIITGVKVSDFTCGFKGFTRKAAWKIFTNAKINGWGFDAEILYLAKKYGYIIKEIPIDWTDRRGSKVKFPQALFSSTLDLVRLKFNDWTGKYDKK